jgi:hypothetical protein
VTLGAPRDKEIEGGLGETMTPSLSQPEMGCSAGKPTAATLAFQTTQENEGTFW